MQVSSERQLPLLSGYGAEPVPVEINKGETGTLS